jgi:two-component sensor histidine kinase
MEALFKAALASREWPVIARYAATTAAVALAMLLAYALDPRYPGYAYLLAFAAIIFTGVIFNTGNGIYATVLSGVVVIFLFASPHESFMVKSARDVIALFLFLGIGISTAALVETLHRAFIALSRANEQLSAAASQRKVLLDELSHRMRNDLSTIASLLTLQGRAVENPSAQAALQTAADRVQVLARVHRRLSIQEGNTVVDSQEFITELCDDLTVTLLELRPIVVRLAVESRPILLQRAVALGLIINELLTNALKYAFPEGRGGEISVEFHQSGEDYYLCVADNGVGFHSEVQGGGMGHRLVRTLAAQLEGRFEVKRAAPGTQFVVTFPRVTPPAPPSAPAI